MAQEEGEIIENEFMDGVDDYMEDLPPFANEENRKLDGDVKSFQAEVEYLDGAIEELGERLGTMSGHLRNVQQEVMVTQQLVDAKGKEVHSEDHMKQLAERESGRIQSDLGKMEHSVMEIQDKLNAVQTNIFRGNEKMDEFKKQMNWNQEELEQWALAMKQKEEDNLALQKYARADESKIKQLTLQIEKLTLQVQGKKQALDAEVLETQGSQIELDKAAEDFRLLHKERLELVRQWEESIIAMQRRDDNIRMAGEQFAALKDEIKKNVAMLTEKEEFLALQKSNNLSVEHEISSFERAISKNRAAIGSSERSLLEFQDEVDVLRNTLGKASSDLFNKRSEINRLQKSIEHNNAAIESKKKGLIAIRKKLKDASETSQDLASYSAEMEENRKSEEAAVKVMEKELENIKKELFKQSQTLHTYRQEEANFIAEIQGAQAATKNLRSKITKLDNETLKQQELIYNQDFQIQQLERKVARASGERTDEEKKALNARIVVLNGELDALNATAKMLRTQLKKMEDESRAVARKIKSNDEEKANLTTVLEGFRLDSESAATTLRKLSVEKENAMVAQSILKLDLKKLRDQLNERADEVFGLENRKFQMKMTMDERKEEINCHKSNLEAQLKVSLAERHSAHMESVEQAAKVNRLQTRYDIMMGRMPSDGGEEKSQSYYIIKAAQEKEELQREGDELDKAIRKAEKEVRALEATLKMLNSRNEKYRSSFNGPAGGSGNSELSELELQANSTRSKVRKFQKYWSEKKDDVETLTTTLSERAGERDSVIQALDELRERSSAVAEQVSTSEERTGKLKEAMETALTNARSQKNVPEDVVPVEEKDFALQAMKEDNALRLKTLSQLSQTYTDIRPALERLLLQHGLPPPVSSEEDVTTPHSGRSSSRAKGSTSSRRSVTPKAVSIQM